MKKINTQGIQISVISNKGEEYIPLTDMAKFKDYRSAVVISNWLSTRYTIQFIGGWEQMHNPTFKVMKFNDFRNEAGTNVRDYADVSQLVCLANLENINAEYIREGLIQGVRLLKLNESAIFQMRSLLGNASIKKLEKNK